jgi:hypothetical protein
VLVQISNVSGVTLNWLVAKCEEYKSIIPGHGYHDPRKAHIITQILVSNKRHEAYNFDPAGDWHNSGDIVIREAIGTVPVWQTASGTVGGGGEWIWKAFMNSPGRFEYLGPTPQVAAMRCYVASRMGPEVDIPEEWGLYLDHTPVAEPPPPPPQPPLREYRNGVFGVDETEASKQQMKDYEYLLKQWRRDYGDKK